MSESYLRQRSKAYGFNKFPYIAALLLFVYLLVFLLYPIYKAFSGSLHDWNPLVGQYDYVGLANFKSVLTNSLFWKSMVNTVVFTTCSVIIRLLIGLALAMTLHSKLVKHKIVFQGLFYMPTITPLVAVSFVWMWMYNPQFGIINRLFATDINWLKNSIYALPAVIIMTAWKDFGYATVLYLGGLMALPKTVFEASEVDGANKWQCFRKITLPLLRPTTLFIVVTSLITYFQAYIQILIMTEGGPGTSTYVISYLIYDEAFVNYNFGSASAMAVILFVIIGLFTALMFKLSEER